MFVYGVGLMFVLIYFGLCGFDWDVGYCVVVLFVDVYFGMVFVVVVVYVAVMIVVGGGFVWFVYCYFGLKFVLWSWFNLDVVWVLSLIVMGVLLFGLVVV